LDLLVSERGILKIKDLRNWAQGLPDDAEVVLYDAGLDEATVIDSFVIEKSADGKVACYLICGGPIFCGSASHAGFNHLIPSDKTGLLTEDDVC
jgi:hypothetical protein